jgi:hypothetical protein
VATRNFNVKNGLTAGNITLDATTNTTTTSNLAVTGNATFTGPNVSLGTVSNLKITSGSAGQYLQTDGTGNLSWQTISGSSSISNGTSNVSIPAINGNINLVASGTTTMVVTSTGANITGTANISGNVTVGNLIGPHANGNSNVNIPAANGNVNISANGVANVIVVTGSGATIAYPLTYGGVTLTNAVAGTGKMVLDGSPSVFTPVLVGPTSTTNGQTMARFTDTVSSSFRIAIQTKGYQLGVSNADEILAYGLKTGDSAALTPYVTLSNSAVTINSANGTMFANNHTASGAATGNANASTITGNLGIRAISATYTDNSAAASATLANAAVHAIDVPTLAAANATVTSTNAATFMIKGAPAAGTNMTITNPYALFVAAGNSYFSANVIVGNLIGPVANGNSNVNIPAANGNINLTVAGNANVFVVTGTGANVGNLGVSANLVGSGNVNFTSAANVSLGSNSNVKLTGGTSGQYLQTDGAGNLSWQTVGSSGISNGTSSVSIPTVNGNINLVAGGTTTMVVTSTGANITGTANISGNANVGNLGTTGVVSATGSISSDANIVAGTNTKAVPALFYTNTANTQYGALLMQKNGTERWLIGSDNSSANGNVVIRFNAITNYVTVTETGVVLITGNANVGNLGTAQVLATANVTAPQLISNVATGTAPLVVTSTTTVANLAAATAGSATTAGTVTTNAQPNITSVGTLTTLTVGNATANTVFGNGTITAAGNVAAGNIIGPLANGNSNVNIPAANGNINLTAVGNTTLVVTGTGANITGTANISGNANVGNLGFGAGTIVGTGNVNAGNMVLTGNLTVGGTTTYINTTTLAVVDPIIDLQTGPNGTALVSNTGYDVGLQLNYYTSAPVTAFMGWKSANAEFVIASNVTQTANVETINTLGNLRVGNIIGNGQALTGITGANVTGQVGNALVAGTVYTNAQPNITSVGTLTSLAVTGNTTVGNLIGPHANGNSNVNIPTANGNVNITAVGNTTLVVTGTGANIAGTLNTGTGNANVGNLGTAQVLATANITAPQLISNVATGTAPFVVTSTTQVANLNVATAGTAGSATTAGTVTTAAQPNITSVGTLSSLAVTGNANAGNLNSTNIVYANNNMVIGSTGGEGGQLVLGYVGITGITGQANSTWNMDVDGSNNFRLFTQNATGVVSGVTMTAYSANTNVTFVGNVSAQYFIGNGSQLTGITAGSASSLANGTSNVSIPVASGNITMGVGGTSNVVTVTTSNLQVGTGTGGSITGANLVSANFFTGTLTTAAQPNITSVGTLTSLNVSGLSIVGNGIAQSPPTGSNILANATFVTGGNGTNYLTVGQYDSANNYAMWMQAGFSNSIQAPYNIVMQPIGGKVVIGNVANNSATLTVSGTLAATGNANVGNLGTSQVLATANVTAPQLISNVATGTAPFVVTSTTQVANLSVATAGTAGSATTAGTVTTAAQPNITSVGTLTSLAVTGNTTVGNLIGPHANGNSNVNIPAANGNINLTAVGNTTLVITGTGANITGTLNASGNANVGNLGTQGISASGNVSANNFIATFNHIYSVATGISAAGSTQGTATAITKDFNVVSTVSSGANGVVLPGVLAGLRITVVNTSANALLVYPSGPAVINSGSAGAAYSQPAGSRLDYISTTTSQWYTLNATYG